MMWNNLQDQKKRRLQLDAVQCLEFSQTEAGLEPLLKGPHHVTERSPRKRLKLSSSSMTSAAGEDVNCVLQHSPLNSPRLNSSKLMLGSSPSRLGGFKTFTTASQLYERESAIYTSDLDEDDPGETGTMQKFANFKGVAESQLRQPATPDVEGLAGRPNIWRVPQNFSRNRRLANAIGEFQAPSQFASREFSVLKGLDVSPTRNRIVDMQQNSPYPRRARKRKPKEQSNTLLNYYSVKPNSSAQKNSSPIGYSSGDSMESSPKVQHSQVASQTASVSSKLNCSRVPSHVRQLFLHGDSQKMGCAIQESTVESPRQSDNSEGAQAKELLHPLSERPTILPEKESSWDAKMNELEFGLLGSIGDESPFTEEETDVEDGFDFSKLPTHVFEMILCRLPLPDLLLNYSRVSKEWNAVISDQRFMPWKKDYHKLKKSIGETVSEMQRNATSNGMNVIQTCLLNMIRHMLRFKLVPPRDAVHCLAQHAKYRGAEQLLGEKAPECLINPCWPMVATLVVLSETFWDVYNVLKLLVSGSCPIVDALEALYCIATFLLYFKRQHGAVYGLHYRVFYALYVFENSWTARVSDLKAISSNTQSGQQNILKYGCSDSKLRLTHEQMRIVNHTLEPDHLVKIVAFAGTGKTSTLVEYTTLHLGTRFLLVVYNKAVSEHAKKCFPGNVECRTSHSLAWSSFGARLRSKLTSKIRPYDIINFLNRAPTNYGQKQQYARLVITSIESFMASADDLITTAHVPTEVRTQDEMPRDLSDGERLNIADDAETIWRKMIDPRDYEVRAVHDSYLKLYQLSKPVLHYDCILVDEAQDCNPAILDVLLSQTCPKLVVGDPNQQIYAFRGAVDALDRVRATHVFYLTQSFRFGPEIAYVSSLALEVLKRKDRKTLVGGTQQSCISGSSRGQIAILARSNVNLFNEAVRLVCKKGPCRSYDPESVSGAFAGGIQGYGLDQLIDIYNLLTGKGHQLVKDRLVARFKDFSALQQYAKNADDNELLGKIQLVKQHTHCIPEYVETIKSRCSTPMVMANVVFSTVHKAKGLEFDTVCLMDDFKIGQFPYQQYPGLELQSEFNVLYVAITRAKKCLCMSTALYFMLLGAHEKLEYPVCVSGEDSMLNCCRCRTGFSPSGTHVMVRRRLDLVGCSPILEGPLCGACSDRSTFVPDVPHPYLGILFGELSLPDKCNKMLKWVVAGSR